MRRSLHDLTGFDAQVDTVEILSVSASGTTIIPLGSSGVLFIPEVLNRQRTDVAATATGCRPCRGCGPVMSDDR
jgi:hypothetical protein